MRRAFPSVIARTISAVGALAGAVVAAGCGDSNPRRMAEERGAVELVRAWPCAKAAGLGARTLGDLVGGDLKTDWTAEAADASSSALRVRVKRNGNAETFLVRLSARTVEPETAGARAAWQACNAK